MSDWLWICTQDRLTSLFRALTGYRYDQDLTDSVAPAFLALREKPDTR